MKTISDFSAPSAWGLGGAARRAAMTLLAVLLTCMAAWAEELGGYDFAVATDNEGSYYKVDCEAALRALSAYVNSSPNTSNTKGKRFKQTADITMTGGNFEPIGACGDGGFGGTYDGNLKIISGLTIEDGNSTIGLFYYVSGTVKNVILVSPVITSTFDFIATGIVGGIAGEISFNASIDHCYVVNPTFTTIDNLYIAYFVGYIYARTTSQHPTVSNCYYYDSNSSHDWPEVKTNEGGTVTGNGRAYAVNFGTGVTASTAAIFSVGSTHYYASGTTITLAALPSTLPDGFTSVYYTVNGSRINGNSFTMSSADAVVERVFVASGSHFTGSGTQSDPYIIHDATGWATFCDCLDDNDQFNRFSGKYVKLGADITVTRMAGSERHDFCGTFDGGNKTLTFNYGSSTSYATDEYIAPFRYVSNATPVGGTADSPVTFKNLNVAGTIYTSAKYAAGIVAQEWGTVNIENCHVSTTINSTVDGDGTHGGIVAVQQNGTLAIRGCVFDGQLLGPSTNSCGGIVGYRSKGGTDIYHTLFAPTAVTMSTTNSATFVRNATASCHEGCYYLQPFNDGTHNMTSQGSIASLVGSSQPANIGSVGTNYGMVQAYANGLKYNNKYYVGSDTNLTVNATGTAYTIGTSTGWNLFCAVLASNAQGFFAGKTVTLGASITVSTMAGDSNHRFSGTFDGGGKTLTVAYGTEGKRLTDQYAAPFRYVDGGTIKDLRVTGTIYTAAKYAAGYVAYAQGSTSITNSVSSVTIDSSVSGDGTHGGFVGAQSNELTIDGCVFNGSLIGQSTNSCGGFVGWRGGTVDISNSLFAPVSVTIDTNDSYTFSRRTGDSGTNITKSYCTQAFGTAQGTQARSVTAGDQYVTTCTVSPKGSSTATYNVSNITIYNYGIERDGKYYYGNGDQVSLTLAHSNRNGYNFKSYTASAGTLNGTTLTVPNADVTISATWTIITYTISYVLNGGTLPADAPESYTIESETFTLPTPTRDGYRFGGWYGNSGFSGSPVNTTIATGSTGDMNLYAKWNLLATLYAADATNDWMTWCSPKEWTIDDSQAAVYTISAVADGIANLTPLTDATVIPAYVPVLIQRKEGVTDEVVAAFSKDGDPSTLAPYSYTSVAYSASTGAVSAQVSNASFYGNPGTTSIEVTDLTDYNANTYTLFALRGGEFIRVRSTAAGFPANRCLLAVNNSVLSGTAASRLAISVGETTSISLTPSPSLGGEGSNYWYSLDGIRIDGKPSRAGVYIYNGKKRVIY